MNDVQVGTWLKIKFPSMPMEEYSHIFAKIKGYIEANYPEAEVFKIDSYITEELFKEERNGSRTSREQ